jgi:hypothetical protein
MRNVSDKVVEKIKTHILDSILSPESRAVYERMWKNTVQPDRPQMTLQYRAEKMQFACRVTRVRMQTCAQNI